MPLILTPKAVSEVLAIRLKDDLIGEKGQVLLIDLNTDKLVVASEEFVSKRFRVKRPGEQPGTEVLPEKSKASYPHSKALPPRRNRPTGIKPRRFMVDVHGKHLSLPHGVAEVLDVMRRAELKLGTRALLSQQLLQFVVPGRESSLTPRMVDARKLGFVTSEPAGMSGSNMRGNANFWSLTNEGRYIAGMFANQLGAPD